MSIKTKYEGMGLIRGIVIDYEILEANGFKCHEQNSRLVIEPIGENTAVTEAMHNLYNQLTEGQVLQPVDAEELIPRVEAYINMAILKTSIFSSPYSPI